MRIIFFAYLFILSIAWIILVGYGMAREKPDTHEPARKGPKVLLMVPCKGNDIELERNLRSAMHQDYTGYKAVAIIEGETDPAFSAIKGSGIPYIIGNYKCTNCSGKVRSLCSAIAAFKGYDLLCILDSDVNAPPGWLGSLVSAMSDKVGIATSYPVFNPVGGFWSKVKHVWGFNGFGLMENSSTRFGWGGSLLFRRSMLDGDGMKRLENSLSDDITLTRLCKMRGLDIAYVPGAKPVVDCADDFHSFIEWSNRQTALAVHGNRSLRKYGIAIYSANILLLITGIAMSVVSSPVYLLFLAPFAIGLAKLHRRSRGIGISTFAAYLIINFVYLYNVLNTYAMRSITWRGREYRIS